MKITMSEQELIQRIVTEHWDFQACRCFFCIEARKLGAYPTTKYPTNPKVSILEFQTTEKVYQP
jgi:hypothetical protein